MNNNLAESCLPCPPGFYCVGDHTKPIACPSGFFCEEKTGFNWKPCPPGTFSNKEGLQNISCKFVYISVKKFIHLCKS